MKTKFKAGDKVYFVCPWARPDKILEGILADNCGGNCYQIKYQSRKDIIEFYVLLDSSFVSKSREETLNKWKGKEIYQLQESIKKAQARIKKLKQMK